ncbi:bifunctional hydroxymethylpyrimidine kinase/phosphomethylpyrimidine kinase [Desulfoferrobacter suflitae]|uniref:bifunctional hydroxymethylpyrimidine kinase/phosphomethylpyrimidine kinase n=1 Tax=Desulfoferrobacter suflitae TaxID=2865782 RepID=UPI0021648C4A|nr:bifunctional hydroxymethylpyrimidine kinase/phosphomethylpyrimidine kinase [Desulfoferrobacter suflitae]MCK8603469.1 bifunctional hydroxymethylpyrimidine kinase/phosphomethylpyrimidine kinase [Desulfoferrobacter suflitae]
MRIYRALTIAGSDSGGGAGIQADLKTFAALGVYGMSAITALTAQNTVGVQAVVELDADFVSMQVHSVVTDIGVDAVKTGMLSSAPIIARVAADMEKFAIENLVVDPVMIAKSGDRLLREEAIDTMIHRLFPLAMVVTPNLHEASALTGMAVEEAPAMKEAARIIKDFGPRYVVIKGGHLEGAPMDILYDGKHFIKFANVRHNTPHTHGTGCTFASAIAAGLARGFSVEKAVESAKDYITGAIEKGLAIGKGRGPVHHFFDLYPLAGRDFE